MRRAATVLGGLAMAGSLALGLTGSAWAAQGTLGVSGKTYTDPGEGCYTVGEAVRLIAVKSRQS